MSAIFGILEKKAEIKTNKINVRNYLVTSEEILFKKTKNFLFDDSFLKA